jgi:hypothetical protein
MCGRYGFTAPREASTTALTAAPLNDPQNDDPAVLQLLPAEEPPDDA